MASKRKKEIFVNWKGVAMNEYKKIDGKNQQVAQSTWKQNRYHTSH